MKKKLDSYCNSFVYLDIMVKYKIKKIKKSLTLSFIIGNFTYDEQ